MKTGMFKYSLLAATMAFSGLTMAVSPSATLLVKGQVSTGTCTATLSTPNIDLGTTSTDKLPATGSYFVKETTTKLVVDCTSPLKYQISMTDNRSDSAVSASDLGIMSSGAATTIMGLGKTADGSKNIGGYFLSFIEDGSNSAVNGSTSLSVTRIGRTTASDSDWKVLPDAAGNNTYHYVMSPLNNAAGGIGNVGYIAFSSTGDAVPGASTSATFALLSRFYLSSELQSITDQEQIDGSVTFNLDYL
ncbi:TPA: DUF1120 domain-containing protein [Klebsiella michiganensis]